MLQMYMFLHQILHYLVKLKLHVLRKCQWYVANMCSLQFEMDCRAKLNFIKKYFETATNEICHQKSSISVKNFTFSI